MIRKLATMVALGSAITLNLLPTVSFAYPPFGWDRTYYADAEHTTEAGAETRYCNGYTNLYWGVKTPYYVTETFPCD